MPYNKDRRTRLEVLAHRQAHNSLPAAIERLYAQSQAARISDVASIDQRRMDEYNTKKKFEAWLLREQTQKPKG